VLTVRAERRDQTQPNVELVVSERPRGIFSRQLILGDTLDTDKVKAKYEAGVLTLRIPVTEQAKPRTNEIEPPPGSMPENSTYTASRRGLQPRGRQPDGTGRRPATHRPQDRLERR
jgi:HSP20 family protein